MTLKNYYLILFLFTCLYVKSSPKEETLFYKVSSFMIEQDSTQVQREFQEINTIFDQGNKGDNYPTVIEKGLEFLKSYEESFPDEAIEISLLIGRVYGASNNLDKSIYYYKKALRFYNNDDVDRTSLALKENTKYSLLLKLGNNYLKKDNKDSAKYFYNLILDKETLDNQLLSFQGSASSNLSGIYMQDSLYTIAQEYALKAIDIHKKRNNKISEAVARGNLASILLDQENFTEAKENYHTALEIIKNENSDRAKKVREQLFFNLAYNLYRLKDYKAYEYQELSYKLKDSLRDKEIRSMIEEITEEYNFESKKELLLKEAENQRLKTQRTFSVIGIFAVIVILSLLYWLKSNKLKLQETEYEKNQELAKIQSELQVKILNATIDGREIERKEIAETLHDSVSALLSSANLHLQASRKQIKGDLPEEIDKTQQIIHEATDKIRDLSHTLVSSVLLKFGLDYAINEMTEKYSNSDFKFYTIIKNVRRYHQQFEIKIHNIVQEFVNNILKHSKASEAYIVIKEEDQKLIINVEDNGVGFDKKYMPKKDGIGLNQIKARIQMMNGTFNLDSNRNKGTRIYIEVPVVEREFIVPDYPIQ